MRLKICSSRNTSSDIYHYTREPDMNFFLPPSYVERPLIMAAIQLCSPILFLSTFHILEVLQNSKTSSHLLIICMYAIYILFVCV